VKDKDNKTRKAPARWLTIAQMSEQYEAFSEGRIRKLILSERENGFCVCVRRVAGRILINVNDFENWVESHKVKTKTTRGK
jgi:hypothetical protein